MGHVTIQKLGTWQTELEQSAMLSSPIWCDHKRGTNWLAIINIDPHSPGGIGRSFCERARGEYTYFVHSLEIGSPVEFGADYRTGSGNRHTDRWYGVVIELSEDSVAIEQVTTARQAVKLSEEVKESNGTHKQA